MGVDQDMPVSRRTFLLTPIGLAACKFDPSTYQISGATMGTNFNVTVANAPSELNQRSIERAVSDALSKANKHLSNWDQSSEISRLNSIYATSQIPVSPILSEVLRCAVDIQKKSAGRFDVTIAPLLELWGFGATERRSRPPAPESLAGVMNYSRQKRILEFGPNTVRKTKADTQIILAAIGKGYGADLIGRSLEEIGATNFLVEIGGDLLAKGRNHLGLPWQIGVEEPILSSNGVLDLVEVNNLGMASSGDYRNFFELDGVRYSHIVDPMTGLPVRHRTTSATVLANNAMLADAWATALLTLGREEGLKVADANEVAVRFTEGPSSKSKKDVTITKNIWFKSLSA